MALILIKHGVHHPIEEIKIGCATKDDSVVLIQDGVFWAIAGEIQDLEAKVYALQDDLCARGYPPDTANVPLLGYPELVDLIAKEQESIS